MQAFNTLRGIAVPFEEPNIDTNQICPTRFNRAPYGPTYNRILFHDRRFNADGSEKPEFILNTPPYRASSILVADRNLGCGSSRETAVMALLAFGIRCVIAKSFGDIFYNNCLKNGLLPVKLDGPTIDGLFGRLRGEVGVNMQINLGAQTVQVGDDDRIGFDIDELVKEKLMLGLDDIQLTERYGGNLEAFEAKYYAATPWLRPADNS